MPGAQVGSYANAINMSDPTHVVVSIGRDNAIAVYRYRGLHRQMRFAGLIPTDCIRCRSTPIRLSAPGRSS